MPHLLAQDLPETLQRFMRDCRLPPSIFQPVAAEHVPQPEQRLLVHKNDMTSTLAAFHESPLQVEILQRQQIEDLYVREVFLRTTASGAVVEYGVIAIALEQYTQAQREAILGGHAPLGALLHRFQIPFVSAPIGFFAVSGAALADTPFSVAPDVTCHGRFNRLSKPSGETLAWILEILPPA